MKRLLAHLKAQLRLALGVGIFAAIAAAICMGAIGGPAMAIKPKKMLGYVSEKVCPGGRLEYYEVKRSYHRPGESEPHVVCVSKNGTKTDITLKALGAVFWMVFKISFLAVFLPVFIPLSALQFGRMRRQTASPANAPPAPVIY